MMFRNTIVAVSILGSFGATCGANDDEAITVKLARRASKITSIQEMELLVNGNSIGSVANGKDVVYKFHPTESGKYTFQLHSKHGTTIHGCEPVDLTVKPGGTVKVTGEFPDISIFSGTSCVMEAEVLTARKSSVEVLSAKLSDDFVEKELSSEIVETLPGIKRTIKRSRTIEHGVSVTKVADWRLRSKLT